METSKTKAIGKLFLLGLTFLYLLAQILFAYQVVQYGNKDILGVLMLSLYGLVAILLFYQGYGWAKWILSISLVAFSILVFLAGLENESTILKLLAIFYLYFGVIPHFSVYLKSLTENEAATIHTDLEIKEGKEGTFTVQEGVYEYPLLVKRYQAMFIDAWLLLFVIIILFAINDDHPTGQLLLKLLLLIAIFIYEPLLTSYSTTIGQKLTGIRVRDIHDPGKRISLGKAYIRFFTKAILGWVSFISIHFNPEHRAIHDFAGSSVVIKVK